MMQHLSRCRAHSAVYNKRTDARALSMQRSKRQDEHQDFDQYETDPDSSCQGQPEPLQLYVRLGRPPRACGSTPLLLVCFRIPELHAFAPALRLLALAKRKGHSCR